MRIAIVSYPNVCSMDVAGISSLLEALPKEVQQEFEWETCCFLPIKSIADGLIINCTHVGLSLEKFDILFLPGLQPQVAFEPTQEFLHWLSTAPQSARWIALGDSHKMLGKIGIVPDTLPSFPYLMAGYLAGLWIINISQPDIAGSLANKAGISQIWQQALRQINGRSADIYRKSAETEITIHFRLDGSGVSDVKTSIPFLDHMLAQISRHGLFDLRLQAMGDLEVDEHHTIEDCGLALGEALATALGDRRGIQRMGSAIVPMDESLTSVSIDFSGRPYSVIQARWNGNKVAGLPVSVIEHFLESFASAARCNLFVQVLAGNDNHHMSEAIFKALARALDQATSLDSRREGKIPSTKERLD